MPVTSAQIRKIARGKVNEANMNSCLTSLNDYGPKAGLDKLWRVAQFIPQVMHESGEFRYDREIWGPTPAQKRYEGRRDLGNVVPGDGKRFMGRGPIQTTGRANTTAFRDWCRATFPKVTVPDFVTNPDLINTDPWEGLTAIWYWSRNNINRWADQGNAEMITRAINGGLNGYGDRLELLTRTSLVLLGYGPTAVKQFQTDRGLKADGAVGDKTRSEMHRALKAAA